MRDAQTREVLQRWASRRNDTAQPIHWETGNFAGRQVYVELVDGDSTSAYAWLAVGRFSVDALNPSQRMEDRQRGAELAATFQLNQFRGVIGDAALRTLADAASVTALTTALAKMNPQTDSKLHALAETTSIIGQTTEQRREVIQNLLANNAEAIPQLISKAMLAASSVEQRRVAETLASDSSGAALLVELAEAGRASAWLLKHPQIEPKLRAAANEELKKRIDILTSRLPDESEDLIKLISNRRKNHVSVAGDVALGAALFTKTCATCHQIGGKGKKVGPNLDGIGTRGLDRLISVVDDRHQPGQGAEWPGQTNGGCTAHSG